MNQNTIDIILDWFDGILPGIVSYVRNTSTSLKDKKLKQYKTARLIYLVIQIIYLLISLYTLYYIYFVQKQDYFMVNIKIKAFTTLISLILLISPTYNISKSLKNN